MPVMLPWNSSASAANIGAGGGGGEPYVAQSVHVDGSVLLKTESLTASGDDTGYLSIAYWFRMEAENSGNVLWVVDPNGTYPSNSYFSKPNDGQFLLHQQFCNPADNACWNANFDGDHTELIKPVGPDWHCVQSSVQTNHTDPDKVYHFYLDDNPEPFIFASSGGSGASAFLMAFNAMAMYIFDDGYGSGLTMDIADLWMAPGQYVDFSVEANRRKFVDASGKPVDLGADGSTPTGIAPAIFFSGDASGFATNKGTGGAFTLTGSLTNASTSPSD